MEGVVVLIFASESVWGERPLTLNPLAGIPILDMLLKTFSVGDSTVLILTRESSYKTFAEWAVPRKFPTSNIILNDCALTLKSDMVAAFLKHEKELESASTIVLVDGTLFSEQLALDSIYSSLSKGSTRILYGDIAPNKASSPAIIALHSLAIPLLRQFATSPVVEGESDSFSDLLRWLLLHKPSDVFAAGYPIKGAVNLENPVELRLLEERHNIYLHERISSLPNRVVETCPARIGLMGNPSDGFRGKTVSFLLDNFSAQVTIEENFDSRGRPRVELVPNERLDPSGFGGLDQLQLHTTCKGYYGGIRLLQATCKTFADLCFKAGILAHLQRGFKMTYDTNIPRMVGLSGSSAIISAAFRALLKFYGLTIGDLNIYQQDLPQVILDIERKELDISAGLQDRVIQTYGGCVHMDFSGEIPAYTSLDPSLLPPMYLVYNTKTGGESGKVHSTVKDRWAQQEPELVEGMRTLGELADAARECLQKGDAVGLAQLMERNFAMRRKLYGDAVVGAENIAMIDIAKEHGLSAKFTGSGGALVCMRSDGQGWLANEAEAELAALYKKHQFALTRIVPSQAVYFSS